MTSRLAIGLIAFSAAVANAATVPSDDANIVYSPYNWYHSGSAYAQTPNPGAYLKFGFTGTSLSVNLDVSPFTTANIPATQYPVIRYSVDGGPPTTLQLTPLTASIECAKGLKSGDHTFLLQYVAGYVFLDFWTPIDVIRVTGFALDDGAHTVAPTGRIASKKRHILFFGDSITNGDDDIATFTGGITNAVDTQDATLGYPNIVAAATDAEFGIIAYGGASWDSRAADGHTPGLNTFWSMFDKDHSRMVKDSRFPKPDERFDPIPDDIYINMGENRTPKYEEVVQWLIALRRATSMNTNIFVIVPFSGRARKELDWAVKLSVEGTGPAVRNYLIDLGDNPYLPDNDPTMFSVDGQHPLAALHAQLGAQIVAARAKLLAGK